MLVSLALLFCLAVCFDYLSFRWSEANVEQDPYSAAFYGVLWSVGLAFLIVMALGGIFMRP